MTRSGRWQTGCILLFSLFVLLVVCVALASVPGPPETRSPAVPTRVVETTEPGATAVVSWTPTLTYTPTATPTVTLTPTGTPTPVPPPPTSLPTPGERLAPAPSLPEGVPPGAQAARVVEVVDGDTVLVLVGGQEEAVRYIGIDTPERGWPGYQAATEANRRLVGSGPVYLVSDVEDRDRYGRLLRYVYSATGIFVNLALVREGWAMPVEYPPNVRYAGDFLAAAQAAARESRGFWSGTSPYDGAMYYGLVVADGGANVRRGPGTDFPVKGTIPGGTPLVIFGRTPEGDWLQVRSPQRLGGWMAAFLVRLNVPVAEVPVARDIPARPAATPTSPPPPAGGNCDPAYPDVCIPPPPPDLDCKDIPYRNFRVLPPDPHRFDRDRDGIGCER